MQYRLKICSAVAALLIICSMRSFAQSISPSVIGSQGTQEELGTFSIEATLGEIQINTGQNQNFILTQGFHQSILSVSPVSIAEQSRLAVSVYPNPISEWLNVTISDAVENPLLQVFDTEGRVVAEKYGGNEQYHRFDMRMLASGTYLLTVGDALNGARSTYRIVKAK